MGVVNTCGGNEMVIGSCGSGGNADCQNGHHDELLCCTIPGYYFEGCQDYFAREGEHVACFQRSLPDFSMVMEGACGSEGQRGTTSPKDKIVHIPF